MRIKHGFTLIELMISVAIVAILAAIAIPAFTEQMRKSRRSEALQGLSDLQLRQEKWRSNRANYLGTDSTAADKTAFGAMPSSDYYTLTITSAAAPATYSLSAAPKGAQTDDKCGTYTVTYSNGSVSKSPTTSGCW